MKHRNCFARSTGTRQNLVQKHNGFQARQGLPVLPNANRKPPSHVWKRFNFYTETIQPVSPFSLYGSWHW